MVISKTETETPLKKLISYRSKQLIKCPVCRTEFRQELLHSGRGRLISETITPELHRLYKTNQQYGLIYPQAYSIVTCPQCLYSAFPNDFADLEEQEIRSIHSLIPERRQKIESLLGTLSFREDRNLILGAASYLLAIDSYQKKDLRVAPTPKKALCCLRAAWLFNDIDAACPNKGFAKVREFLYLRAARYYKITLDIMGTDSEPQPQFLNLLGPDTDKNWGFDGVIYMNSYLTHKYIKQLYADEKERLEFLRRARRNLGKLYGHGKASFQKPSLLVSFARELYDTISAKLEQLDRTTAPVQPIEQKMGDY